MPRTLVYPSKAIPFEPILPETPPSLTFPEPQFREAPLSPQIWETKGGTSSYEMVKETSEKEAPEKVEDRVTRIIRQLAQAIFSSPIGFTRISEDSLYGLFVEVEVFGDVHQALLDWLRLIDALKILGINIPVYPKILGKFDTAPGEFGRFVGLGLAKMKVPLKLERPIDITEILSQERDK